MTRVEAILVSVRDTLNDPRQERYTTDMLLRLINEAQKVIAVKANLLRDKQTIGLEAGVASYTLPYGGYKITRVLDTNKTKLPVYTHSYMDKHFGEDWETHTGPEIEAVVYDKQQLTSIKVYPIPTVDILTQNEYLPVESGIWNPAVFNSYYGVVVDSALSRDAFSSVYGLTASIDYVVYTLIDGVPVITSSESAVPNTLYGILVDLDDSLLINTAYDPAYGVTASIESYYATSPYGVVTEVDTLDSNSPYGILTSLTDQPPELDVYFNREPLPIVAEDDELEVGFMFDKAIKFYVTGMALRNDNDTQNRQMGAEELNFFSIELSAATKESSIDYANTSTRETSSYIGAF